MFYLRTSVAVESFFHNFLSTLDHFLHKKHIFSVMKKLLQKSLSCKNDMNQSSTNLLQKRFLESPRATASF